MLSQSRLRLQGWKYKARINKRGWMLQKMCDSHRTVERAVRGEVVHVNRSQLCHPPELRFEPFQPLPERWLKVRKEGRREGKKAFQYSIPLDSLRRACELWLFLYVIVRDSKVWVEWKFSFKCIIFKLWPCEIIHCLYILFVCNRLVWMYMRWKKKYKTF